MLRLASILWLGMMASPLFAELKISNLQVRSYKFGPERPSLEIVPGDEVIFRFLVSGVKTDETGKMDAEIIQKITDPEGKVIVNTKELIQEPLAFAGDSFPYYVPLSTGVETLAGEYLVHITLKDNMTKTSTSIEKKVTVTKPNLGIVRPRLSYDPEGKSDALPNNPVGQRVYFRFFVVGFEREKKVDLQIRVQIFDSEGKETLKKPLTLDIQTENPKEIEEIKTIPFNRFLYFTRAGEFKIVFTATDRVSNKSAKWESVIKITD